MATKQHNAETPRSAIALLGELESPLTTLNTRLEFLVQYFEDKDATMPDGALFLFLSDCLKDAREAHEAWSEAWDEACSLRLVPKAAA